MTAPFRPSVGDRVTIDHPRFPGVFVVERVKETKAIVRRAGALPGDRGVDAHLTLLRPAAEDGATLPPADELNRLLAKQTEEFAMKARFTVGVVVKLKKAWGSYTTDDVFAVISTNDKTVSIAKLGGEGGRYARVGHSGLDIVEAFELAAVPF